MGTGPRKRKKGKGSAPAHPPAQARAKNEGRRRSHVVQPVAVQAVQSLPKAVGALQAAQMLYLTVAGVAMPVGSSVLTTRR